MTTETMAENVAAYWQGRVAQLTADKQSLLHEADILDAQLADLAAKVVAICHDMETGALDRCPSCWRQANDEGEQQHYDGCQLVALRSLAASYISKP